MCGIFAVSGPKGSSSPLEKALGAIAHRGPDDRGVFSSDQRDCHLGHVRLSILDLSAAGHQPMSDASGRYVIVFNGEIYNYRELKKALVDQGHSVPWRSGSDTEVILEGFAREGFSFLAKLNGIFALAIYDKLEQVLHILRDPLGIKPIFFTEQHGNVYFCSELKGILAMPDMRRNIRLQSIADRLAYMYVPEPYTVFEEFFKLEPGVLLSFREGRQISSTKLFDYLESPLSFSSEQEMIERLYDAFSTAVRRQLISDAPMSLMLSGGLDSSAVAYEAVRQGGDIKSAYTISFSDEDRAHDQQSDDLRYARLMADRLGLRLEVIQAERDFIRLLPELSGFLEDGISDPAAINTYLICRAASQNGVKVILTGQGPDEFLGGYRRYLVERALGAMPAPLRKLLSLLGLLIPANAPGRFNSLTRRINRAANLAQKSRKDRLLGLYIWGEPGRISGLFKQAGDISIGKDLLKQFEEYAGIDDISAMMKVDHRFDLLSLNLTYTDRMSMAVGVEARVPFLDFDLVRVMNSIPTEVKLKRGIAKYPLKKAMEQHLPREIVYREKAGFALPIRAWMRHDSEVLKYFFERGRIQRQGIFNPDALDLVCKEQFSGKKDHANVLFSMLCTQAWLDSIDNAHGF